MTLYQWIVMRAALMTWNFGGPYVFMCHRHGPSAGRHVPGCRHPGCASHVRRSALAEMLPWVLLQLCRIVMWNEARRQKTNCSAAGNWRRFAAAQREMRT